MERLTTYVVEMAKKAKQASRDLASVSTAEKDAVLNRMAKLLIKHKSKILSANKKDIACARKEGATRAFLDRLLLNEKRLKAMASMIMEVAGMPDPIGEVVAMWTRPNGLKIGKILVPIGTIAIIYESRPNVTSDCIALCFKSGNSVILKGGRESFHSNKAIFSLLRSAIKEYGINPETVNFIETTDRKAVDTLLKQDHYVDLVIPRGGETLIEKVVETSKIPVIRHSKGLCHIFIDKVVDEDMALDIVLNAKVQRPSVCNAVETVLVHQRVARQVLPKLVRALKKHKVQVRGCPVTCRLAKGVVRATEEDWSTEYLDLILSIKVVPGIYAAVNHINTYSSGLSEAIITQDYRRAMEFLDKVDSACVYVNASTRFTDGNQFGLGAEIGISTGKLHARGPMGLRELTSYKYIIFGNGQIRTS